MASDAQLEMDMMMSAGLNPYYGHSIHDLPNWEDSKSIKNVRKMKMEKPRNIILSDVEMNYAKLRSPVENPFSKAMQYEMQIVLSAEQAAELKGLGLNVKEKDGKFFFAAKRNAVKSNGEDNGAVRVVDQNKQPFDQNIGNESRGNVILWVYPYSAPGRNGVSASLTAVQVVKHVPYESDSVDFDVVGGESEASAESLF